MIARTLFVALAAIAAAFALAEADADLGPVGGGTLVWQSPSGPVDLPVMGIDLGLEITGIVLRATLVEEFTNPTGETIDATYALPLPEGAAVLSMEMRIGDRRIVAAVRERDEARATYRAAREEGRKASLVEQVRPNLFTTAVANINPGETVSVRIEILDEADYLDGAFRAVFPLTLTPRYGARAPERGSAAPPPSVSFRACIDAGFPLAAVDSPSHAVRVERDGETSIVLPAEGTVTADRDLVLRWSPERGAGPAGAAFVEDRADGRYALTMLLPPVPDERERGLSTETLFVVDVSGSMDGPSIAAARAAVSAALDRLRPDDTFNLMRFSDESDLFRDAPLCADRRALADAQGWIESLDASGGTEIVPALIRALDLASRGDEGRARRVVLVTDAAVSNEEETIRAVAPRLGATRLHVVGIGAAPNRHLLRKLARLGRGSCEFVARAADAEERIDALLRRIERPVLTDVVLEWEGSGPAESFPERVPDLYAGEPLLVWTRLAAARSGARLVLAGRTGEGRFQTALDVAPEASAQRGIAARWARAKVESLLDRLREGADPDAVRREVIALALEFHLATRYTSLVAVEETPTALDPARSVRVASGIPSGSTLTGGFLPEGGTLDPLSLRAGILLMLAAAGLAWSARRMRP